MGHSFPSPDLPYKFKRAPGYVKGARGVYKINIPGIEIAEKALEKQGDIMYARMFAENLD